MRLKNIIKITMCLAVCICLITPLKIVYSQSVSALENKLQELNNRHSREFKTLDSLKHILDSRAKQIDAEKKKSEYDESNIKKLMSVSITVSNKVDEQQKKLYGITNDIEKTKRELDERYTAVIDSLSSLENSGRYSGDKNELKARILRLTEKKILTAPMVYSLTFNPEKILTLDPAAAKSGEEKIIYNEYLNEALAEVNSKLKHVKSLNDEIGGIVSLQKKTSKFLEEVDFGSNIDRTALTLRGQETANMPTTTKDNTFTEDSRNLAPQVQTYIYILKQLDVPSSIKTTGKFSFDAGKKNISLHDYSELLLEVEKRLTEYQAVLTNKIGNRK